MLLVLMTMTSLARSTVAHEHRYDNYSLVKCDVPDQKALEVISGLRFEIKMWLEPHVGDSAAFLIPPDIHDVTLKILDMHHISYNVTHPNIQRDIDHEKEIMASGFAANMSGQNISHNLTWNNYHSLEDIYSFYRHLETKFKNLVKVTTIGHTHEGRPLKVLKICQLTCQNKSTIWVDAGIHAREWISPASTLYMVNQLLENRSNHSRLFNRLNWFVLPMTNPDGYAYSRTSDRFWRKNRVPNKGCNNPDVCYGVDLNRNFAVAWNHVNNSAHLYDPAHETFHGFAPFSEAESKAVATFIWRNRNSIKLYVSIHSFGQFVLTPWGFTKKTPPLHIESKKMIERAVQRMSMVDGKTYKHLEILEMTRGIVSGGNSADWVMGVAKVPFAMALELRDKGNDGFELPTDQIVPTGQEVWAFHKSVARQILQMDQLQSQPGGGKTP